MMHANIYANIYSHSIIITNAINKAAKATKTTLRSARIDSLREDGPARGQLLPSRVASCRNAKNNRRAETKTNTEPPPCVIYPKEGKETLEVNLEKTWSRDQREMGSGVGYAKGRY